jgi:uncharacterized protein (DUF1015 family)
LPEIKPFAGIRFNPEIIEDFSNIVAPPYDVIDPDDHAELLARDPYNVVRLILGSDPGSPGDYEKEAALMAKWLSEGILVRDRAQCYYLIEDTFLLPGESAPYRRWGIIGRVRLEPLDTGRIHPHERTHQGPKEDRLRLMKVFKGNLSQVFSLFDGDAAIVKETLAGAFTSKPDIDIQDKDGIGRKMWVVEDPVVVEKISELLSDRNYYIADGHHRYETAVTYAELMAGSDADSDPGKGYNFLMMALMGMEDPGLAILPTHRLLYGFENFDFSALKSCLSEYFHIDDVEPAMEKQIRNGTSPSGLSRRGFVLYCPGTDRLFTAGLREDVDLAKEIPDMSGPVRELDVTLAERFLMMGCLDMTPEQISHQEHLEYHKDVNLAMEKARAEGQVLVLMPATGMSDLVAVTSVRERMPQKSTFFYPKLLTGLVFYDHGS